MCLIKKITYKIHQSDSILQFSEYLSCFANIVDVIIKLYVRLKLIQTRQKSTIIGRFEIKNNYVLRYITNLPKYATANEECNLKARSD